MDLPELALGAKGNVYCVAADGETEEEQIPVDILENQTLQMM